MADVATDPLSTRDEEGTDAGSSSSADGPPTVGPTIDLTLGVVRFGVGAALVAAPRWAGRVWVGPGADGPGSLVFARALGARDVALGIRIVAGARRGEPVRHWIASGFVADAADAAATMIAFQHLTPLRRALAPVVAAGVGGLGWWAVRQSAPEA